MAIWDEPITKGSTSNKPKIWDAPLQATKQPVVLPVNPEPTPIPSPIPASTVLQPKQNKIQTLTNKVKSIWANPEVPNKLAPVNTALRKQAQIELNAPSSFKEDIINPIKEGFQFLPRELASIGSAYMNKLEGTPNRPADNPNNILGKEEIKPIDTRLIARQKELEAKGIKPGGAAFVAAGTLFSEEALNFTGIGPEAKAASNTLKAFKSADDLLTKVHPEISHTLYETPRNIDMVSPIYVAEAKRSKGLGTSAVTDLVNYAEENGKTITAEPSDFLKKFGFEPAPNGKMVYTPISQTSKVENPLITEAKKYKSADEFIKAQGEPLYHGTQRNFDKFDINQAGTRNPSDTGYAGKGVYFTNSKDAAKTFADGNDIYKTTGKIENDGRVVEAFVKANNILEVNDFTELNKKLGLPLSQDRPKGMGLTEFIQQQSSKIQEEAKKLGYDGIKVDAGGKNGEFELVVFDTSKIKTKSELTDIYNKANNINTTSIVKQNLKELPPATKVTVPKKDIPLNEELGQRETALMLEGEYINNNSLNALWKYADKRNDVLPEVTGIGNSKFARTGDKMAEELGYASSEEMRTAFNDFVNRKRKYQENVKSFATEKKNYINSQADELALNKIAETEGRKTDTLIKNTEKEAVDNTRLAERQQAFDSALEKIKADEELRYKKAQNIRSAFQGQYKEQPNLFQKLKNSLRPIRTLPGDTQTAYKEFTRGRNLAKEAGNKELGKIGVPQNKGIDTIFDYQAGKETPYNAKIKQEFDTLFNEAKDKGIDTGYRENYLPQVYKENPTQIHDKIIDYLTDRGMSLHDAQAYTEGKQLSEEVANRLGVNPAFSKDRVFPSYRVAMEYGLTPRYTNPDQLLAYYRESLDRALADKKFLNHLVDEGKVLPGPDAPNSWKPVELPLNFQGYKADPQVAKFINNLFGTQDKGFFDTVIENTANLSKRAQEIALSAGFPGTNVNFFSMGQAIKQITAGDFKAIPAFVRANFNERSIKFFKENQQYIDKMANEGIDLSGRIGTYDKVYKSLKEDWKELKKNPFKKETYKSENRSGFAELTGESFDKAFNEKTFGSFMPQLYTQTFKDSYKNALKKGLGEAEASKLAGDITKNMFGMLDDVGRSKATKDKLSALFFAPQFREGIINTLFNTGKAGADVVKQFGGLRGKLAPELSKNRKLLAGMILTYGLYNAVNKKLNGHYMWDNPDNRKFALQIPSKDGTLTYVEFMPSFLAFARNMAQGTISLIKGDIKDSQQKFGSVFSMPIKTTSEILANKDYFGRDIYKDTDTRGEKSLKIAKYIGLSVNHPYIKEIINQVEDKKPLYQSIIAALELPVKFSSKDKVAQQEFYKAIDAKKLENSKALDKVRPVYENIKSLVKAGKVEEAKAILEAMSPEDRAVYKKLKTTDKRSQTMKAEATVYDTVQQVHDLVKAGKTEEAKQILSVLTPEELKAYRLAKKNLPKD
jgi:hypothetical protein